MKTKDLIIGTVAAVILIGALYFIYITLFPSTSGSTNNGTGNSSVSTKTNISENIDTDTLNKLKSYKDYGGTTLDNIGRVNPFGPLE
jgi:hypothetical protein